LDYVWGDDLAFPWRRPNKTNDFPMLVVIRPDQVEAYEYAVRSEQQRHDLATALGEMGEAVRLMKSLL
jgi:hypothetical protein